MGDTLVTWELRDAASGTERILTHKRFPNEEAKSEHAKGWSGWAHVLVRLLGASTPHIFGRVVLNGRMPVRIVNPSTAAILFVVAALTGGDAFGQDHRFEADIRAFERADSIEAPPKNAILFVGSSSIVGWRSLEDDFRNLPVIQRGFGGSEISDVIHFADRIVLAYEPRMIVLYAGDNDIAAGKPPKEVADDFAEFVALVHAELPETRMVFIAIKPSIARRQVIDEMRTANALIKMYTRSNARLEYVDVFAPMLDGSGEPREELFLEDGLHMNERGYALWARLVAPYLTGN